MVLKTFDGVLRTCTLWDIQRISNRPRIDRTFNGEQIMTLGGFSQTFGFLPSSTKESLEHSQGSLPLIPICPCRQKIILHIAEKFHFHYAEFARRYTGDVRPRTHGIGMIFQDLSLGLVESSAWEWKIYIYCLNATQRPPVCIHFPSYLSQEDSSS
jgi:hypothetical protein